MKREIRMNGLRLSVSALLSVAVSSAAFGQLVQLPTFQYTTVNTTVLVPDQGEVFLGGIARAQDGRNEFGTPLVSGLPVLGRPFRNVGIGQSRSASNHSVRVQIHDFEAMDQAVLAEAARRRGGLPADAGVAVGAARNIGAQQLIGQLPADEPVASVAEIERRERADAEGHRHEMAALIERAQAAEADGRPRVAQIYYRIVAHDSRQPDLRAVARVRLDALSGRSAAKVAAAEAVTPAR